MQHWHDKKSMCQYSTHQYFHKELGINAIQQAVEAVAVVEFVIAVETIVVAK